MCMQCKEKPKDVLSPTKWKYKKIWKDQSSWFWGLKELKVASPKCLLSTTFLICNDGSLVCSKLLVGYAFNQFVL
jgi:hypothetical protein